MHSAFTYVTFLPEITLTLLWLDRRRHDDVGYQESSSKGRVQRPFGFKSQDKDCHFFSSEYRRFLKHVSRKKRRLSSRCSFLPAALHIVAVMSESDTRTTAPDILELKKHFQFYPDYPKKGVNFVDILPVLRDPVAFELLITHILTHIFNITIPKLADGKRIDAVVGLDARGFLLAPIIAMRLGAAFVPVRKQGKLPGKCVQATYAKEYGQDIFEMQESSLKSGSTVLVIDDLIATGGSAKAAGELVEKLGSKTVEYIFVVGLPFLNGASKLNAPSYQ